MSELRELYQSVILDHNKSPRNFGEPESSNRHAEGDNPLCGDHISVHVSLEDGVVRDVGFVGQGCAISTASASLMTDLVKGKSREEIIALKPSVFAGRGFERMGTRALGVMYDELKTGS